MKFTFAIARNPLGGNDVDVQITAEDAEVMSTVVVTLDGGELCDERVDDGTTSWQRTFAGVGSASPHLEHSLIATVLKDDGTRATGRRQWQDLI
jgi:hypothetical protein